MGHLYRGTTNYRHFNRTFLSISIGRFSPNRDSKIFYKMQTDRDFDTEKCGEAYHRADATIGQGRWG